MKKMKFSLILTFCFYSINVFSQLQIGTNVIPNGSFENGIIPSNYVEHNLPLNSVSTPILDNWTTGYTANSCGTSICYGGLPSTFTALAGRTQQVTIYDYNASDCRYNNVPNFLSSAVTNIQPQEGDRFIYLHGGYQNYFYPVYEGGSVSTSFNNAQYLCDGVYTLSFWAKAPEESTNSACPIGASATYLPHAFHPENKLEVVLRQSTNYSNEIILYTTPQLAIGVWQQYTTVLNLATLQGYDRLEFRIRKQGNGGSMKAALIDNVGLFYTDHPAHIVLSHSTTITCGETVDLDAIVGACDNPGDWMISGNPMVYTLAPITTTTYSRVCYDNNGCFESKEEVTVYVNDPPTDTIDLTLCHDDLYALPPTNCSQNGFISWTFPDGSIQSSLQFDGGMYLTQEGTYEVKVDYNNGCECTTVIHVTHTSYIREVKNVTACFGSELTLEFNPFLDITNHTFTWNGVAGNSTNTITASSYETIIGKAFDANGCMTQEVVYNLSVNPYPLIVEKDTVRCDNCIDIAADVCPIYSVSGNWSHDSSTTSSINICPQQDESYTYSCYDANGCIVQQNVFEITYEHPITYISIGISEVVGCAPNNARPPVQCSHGASYKWYDENGNFIIETNQPELPMQTNSIYNDPNVLKGENYTVEVYDKYGCLMCIETFNITWFNNDKRYFIDGDLVSVCVGDCITLDLINVNGAQMLPFSWSLPGSPVLGTHIKNITDSTFEFCPPSSPVTLTLQYVDPNDPSCLLFYQEVTVVLKECRLKKAGRTTLEEESIKEGKEVTIYPNPSNGTFMLVLIERELSGATYSITDATGRLVRGETVITSDNTEIKLDRYERGVYLITINLEDSIIVKKILIE